MKQTPADKSLSNRLHASKFSAAGFLGDDPRTIDEIIAADHLLLQSTGLTREQLVAGLRRIHDQAKAALGAETEISPQVVAVYYESMGKIPSPFRGEGVFEKGEAVVTDVETGRTLNLTPLGLHLIGKHGFFQGLGCRYRIDPQTAADLLAKIG